MNGSFAAVPLRVGALSVLFLLSACSERSERDQLMTKLQTLESRIAALEQHKDGEPVAERLTQVENALRQLQADHTADQARLADQDDRINALRTTSGTTDAAKTPASSADALTAKVAALASRVEQLSGSLRRSPASASHDAAAVANTVEKPTAKIGNLELVGFDSWSGTDNAVFSVDGKLTTAVVKQRINGFTIDTIDAGSHQVTMHDAAGAHRTLIQKAAP